MLALEISELVNPNDDKNNNFEFLTLKTRDDSGQGILNALCMIKLPLTGKKLRLTEYPIWLSSLHLPQLLVNGVFEPGLGSPLINYLSKDTCNKGQGRR